MVKCVCGREIAHPGAGESIDMEWAHQDDGDPFCREGRLDEATGEWVDLPYATPAPTLRVHGRVMPDAAVAALAEQERRVPVKWGQGGPEVGEVVRIWYDGRVDMEITEPAAMDMVRCGMVSGFSVGPDAATLRRAVATPVFTAQVEEIGQRMRRLGEAFAKVTVSGEAAKALTMLRDHFQPVIADALDPDPEPTDPRERALWRRQHRNTGPTPRKRHRNP